MTTLEAVTDGEATAMRDTGYATELRRAEDSAGQRIERLYVKGTGREEIRFSWWKDGNMVVRPLDLPEDELLSLLNEAFEKRVFSAEFLHGLHSSLSSHVEQGRFRASLERLHASGTAASPDERERTNGLIAYLRRAKPISEDFPEIDDPPPEPVEL